MSDPRVSIIVAVKDCARFIAEALESALAQTHRATEVLVVDDGSTDESAEIAARFPGVRVISQPNQGVSAARNVGIRESRGELLVFLDADDRLWPEAVAIGVEHLRARPDHAFVHGFSRPIRADGSVAPATAHIEQPASYAALLAGQSLVPPATAIFRRAAVEAVGGFPVGKKIAEDHDLYLRLAQRHPIFCHERVVCDYRRHGANASAQSATETLLGVLGAMEAQRAFVEAHPEHRSAYERGRAHWIRLFGPGLSYELVGHVRRARPSRALRTASALLRLYPRGIWELIDDRLLGRR